MYVACMHLMMKEEAATQNAVLIAASPPPIPQAPWQLAGDQQLVSAQSVD